MKQKLPIMSIGWTYPRQITLEQIAQVRDQIIEIIWGGCAISYVAII